jgi:hypothetical protein
MRQFCNLYYPLCGKGNPGIALRFRHGINGLVRHWSFVDDIRVLTALDAAVALAWSSKVKRRFASLRDMAAP